MFATEDVIGGLEPHENVSFEVVATFIAPDEDPLVAIRRKKDASIPVGIKQLANQELDAFVSIGNTGALIAAATLMLKKSPGISRPALVASLPTKTGTVAVIDVGGNLNATAEQLFQFAELASENWRHEHPGQLPRVGLLNIGTEATKGTPSLRQAHTLLQGETSRWNFIGNIEGRDVFEGRVDILVTDGFTGNVFLKTSEGIAALIFDRLEGEHPLKPLFDYTEYPGARLLGIEATIVKCHGASSPQALQNGLLSLL